MKSSPAPLAGVLDQDFGPVNNVVLAREEVDWEPVLEEACYFLAEEVPPPKILACTKAVLSSK